MTSLRYTQYYQLLLDTVFRGLWYYIQHQHGILFLMERIG